jgi:hypothetical protein
MLMKQAFFNNVKELFILSKRTKRTHTPMSSAMAVNIVKKLFTGLWQTKKLG